MTVERVEWTRDDRVQAEEQHSMTQQHELIPAMPEGSGRDTGLLPDR